MSEDFEKPRIRELSPKDQLDAYLAGPIIKISDILRRVEIMETQLFLLPKIDQALSAQDLSIKLLANTYEEYRTDHKELVNKDRDSIPRDIVLQMLKWNSLVSAIPALLMAALFFIFSTFYTKQNFEASLNNIRVTQKENRANTQAEIARSTDEIKKEIAAVKETKEKE